MLMSDKEIREAMANGEIELGGFDPLYIGPSSVDLHLDNNAMILSDELMSSSDSLIQQDSIDGKTHIPIKGIDVTDKKKSASLFAEYKGWDNIIIYPKEFYILSSVERIKLAPDIAGFMHGRSSLARMGLNIHAAGFFDPGFEGTATLEVVNFTKWPIKLPKHIRICQMVFMRTGTPCDVPYNKKSDSKYVGQTGPTVTGVHSDFAH